jgi:hypothetical protein
LKAYEGYFSASNNQDQVIQTKVLDNALVFKALWTNAEIRTVPLSDTTFYSEQGIEGHPITVTFSKDAQGVYRKFGLGVYGTWNREKNYKPLVRKEIAHTPGQLKPFEGLYESDTNNGMAIQITEKDNKLVLKQYWDANEITFLPDSAMHFFCREQLLFTLLFSKDSTGEITRMIAFGSVQWNRAKPPRFNSLELKAFEGKYQLKEDKDDIIQIAVNGPNLVVKQLWDGKEIEAEPRSESFFYCPSQSYSLNFTKGPDGNVVQVLVLNTDLFEKIKQ